MIGAVSKLAQKTPLDIESLTLYKPNENLSIIKNCRGLKKVRVSFSEDDKVKFADVEKLLYNVKIVFLSGLDSIQGDDIIRLFQKWIEEEKEQGSRIRVEYSHMFPTFKEFLEKSKRKYKMIIKRPNYEYRFYVPIGGEKFVRLFTWSDSFEIDVVRAEEMTSDEDSDSCTSSDSSDE